MVKRTRVREAMVNANGVELCVDTFGDPNDPAILLIGGAAMSMDWWDEEFCERLADRFVIRYDNRDTGRSVSWPAGAPGYDGNDLVADVVGVLDALGVARAHLVGVSMGGGIAQQVALEYPARIASLALIAASPITRRPGAPELPPAAEKARAAFANPPPEPDWSDRAAVIEYIVEGERPFRGSLARDEVWLRATAGRIVDRTVDIAAATTNHWVMDHGDPVESTLDAVDVPTLVLHGTEDPLFPYPHGEALAGEIAGARLIPLVGMGHEVPPRAVWDIVIPALLSHTR